MKTVCFYFNWIQALDQRGYRFRIHRLKMLKCHFEWSQDAILPTMTFHFNAVHWSGWINSAKWINIIHRFPKESKFYMLFQNTVSLVKYLFLISLYQLISTLNFSHGPEKMRKGQLQYLYHHNEVTQITLMAENNLSNPPSPLGVCRCSGSHIVGCTRSHILTHIAWSHLQSWIQPVCGGVPEFAFLTNSQGMLTLLHRDCTSRTTLGEPLGQRLACLESWLTDGLKLWLNCTCLGMASSQGRRTALRMRYEGVLRTHSNGTRSNCSSGCGVINFVILINLFAY